MTTQDMDMTEDGKHEKDVHLCVSPGCMNTVEIEGDHCFCCDRLTERYNPKLPDNLRCLFDPAYDGLD